MQYRHLTEEQLQAEIKDLQLITDKWECLREYHNRQLLKMIKKTDDLAFLKGYAKAIEDITERIKE